MSAVLTVYLGVMGSGKSYEIVSNFIVPALTRGQVVATNIYGLNIDALNKHIGRDISHLVVTLPAATDELLKREHWPEPNDPDKVSTIPRGAVLALDECYKIFPPSTKVPMYVLEYFREQRHFVDDEGRTAMSALAFQDWADVHRSIRSVAALMFHMSKFGALAPFMKVLRPLKLGFDYRVAVYTKIANPDRERPNAIKPRRYDPKIFQLYQSYATTGSAFEEALDSRGSLLSSWYVTVFIPIMLLLAYWAGQTLLDKFGTPDPTTPPAVVQSAPATPGASPTPVPQPQAVVVAPDYLTERLSKTYRLLGTYTPSGAQSLYLVQHSSGYVRHLTLSEVKGATSFGSHTALVLHNDELVTTYSGASASSSSSGSGLLSAPGSR